jgi:hypothetical protein
MIDVVNDGRVDERENSICTYRDSSYCNNSYASKNSNDRTDWCFACNIYRQHSGFWCILLSLLYKAKEV